MDLATLAPPDAAFPDAAPPDAAPADIRSMRPADAPELLRLTHALVGFAFGAGVTFDEAEVLKRGFGPNPDFGAFVADAGDGALVGMAVFYEMPFMHLLRPILVLKWLYVDPSHRGSRVGRQLMQRLARHALATGHSTFRWSVLHDDAPAQAFYSRLGAMPEPDWQRWVLPADALKRLAMKPA